jgi:hypothetical protein
MLDVVDIMSADSIADASTSDSPQSMQNRPTTPQVTSSVLKNESANSSASGSVSSRKRRSPASPDDATPRALRQRPVLHPIDNEVSCHSPALTRHGSLTRTLSLGATPSSFIGSPVKKKRRLSSIKRL